MATFVTIARTKFVNLDRQGNEGDVSYGFRVYDSNGGDYSNNHNIEILQKTPAELVEMARELSETGHDLIEFAEATQPGIWFNDEFLAWEEIKK